MTDITKLARQHGLSPDLVRSRISRGWELEKALTTPVMSPSAAGRRNSRKSPWSRQPFILR